jgi:6-pyruvoyltetrahydropterin/6-carboxytetrahydropterin synthase
MVFLTRIERFNAAHKLWVGEWSEAQNNEIFGKCANKNWHGHNYVLHVTVKGKPDPLTGFVIDAKVLGGIIRTHVTDKLDHSNLNLDVDFIPPTLQPTTENLTILIWQQLAPLLKTDNAQLYSIKLYETDTIYAEYQGGV